MNRRKINETLRWYDIVALIVAGIALGIMLAAGLEAELLMRFGGW